MSDFERQLPPTRLAEIHFGDTLQRIATRELGDANRWPELVWLNSLLPPYVTSDPAAASDSVLLAGAFIRVPSVAGVVEELPSNGQVFERDCQLQNKRLVVDADGDFAVVSGADNLRQQLTHRLNCPRGELVRHPEYGCLTHSLVGKTNGPLAAMLGAEYVRAALKADYRVSKVASSTASVTGDAVRVIAKAEAIDGAVVDVVT